MPSRRVARNYLDPAGSAVGQGWVAIGYLDPAGSAVSRCMPSRRVARNYLDPAGSAVGQVAIRYLDPAGSGVGVDLVRSGAPDHDTRPCADVQPVVVAQLGLGPDADRLIGERT